MRYIRCKPSAIHEDHVTHNLRLVYQDEDKELVRRRVRPGGSLVRAGALDGGAGARRPVRRRARRARLLRHRRLLAPSRRRRQGSTPAVRSPSPRTSLRRSCRPCGAASKAMALLAEERGSLITHTDYPAREGRERRGTAHRRLRLPLRQEHRRRRRRPFRRRVRQDPPRRGPRRGQPVHLLGGYPAADPADDRRARSQPGRGLLVQPAHPRALFRDTCRKGGLNEYLFEMANIRDQNTWVHMDEPEQGHREGQGPDEDGGRQGPDCWSRCRGSRWRSTTTRWSSAGAWPG